MGTDNNNKTNRPVVDRPVITCWMILLLELSQLLGSQLPKSQLAWYARRSHADSIWRQQVLDVGRDSCLHHGWLLHWSCRAGSWLCGRDGSFSQRGEICNFADSLWFSADRGRDPGSYQWVGHFFSAWFGSVNFAREQGGQSLSFCFNAFQSPSSTLTQCFCRTVFCLPTTWISAAPIFNFFINFFLLREYTYRGLKKGLM